MSISKAVSEKSRGVNPVYGVSVSVQTEIEPRQSRDRAEGRDPEPCELELKLLHHRSFIRADKTTVRKTFKYLHNSLKSKYLERRQFLSQISCICFVYF